jgi:hypothetical protein
MKIAEALKGIREIWIAKDSPPVFRTAAEELQRLSGAALVERDESKHDANVEGVFSFPSAPNDFPEEALKKLEEEKQREGVYLRLDERGTGCFAATKPYLVFGFFSYLLKRLAGEGVEYVRGGRLFRAAFAWNRSTYDFFLTQEGRIQRGLDKETYIRRLAESGFTHVEVNGLAYPMSLETGPKGETYHMFYTYCPALDQFVAGRLNKGLYPHYYLSANLADLKRNAELAVKYGLVPGLLCFEPRSVPEEFFARYPMLRGARVDHPFRSFKPRFNMTIVHPKVRELYAEMMTKLISEVPQLAFLSIWTNDSGSGFEHTKSLYVGRNGGAYLIREWKDDAEIARVAGELAVGFFRLLRDAARSVNPDFRVMTRLESFYGEHEVIWNGLGDQVDVEAASLVGRGWEMPYTHPRYPDSNVVNAGTVYQDRFDNREKELMADLENRSSRAHFYFAAGPNSMFAPLLGIPYPSLTYRRLKLLCDNGVDYLAHSNGTCPPELVPYNINHEVLGLFQFNPQMDAEEEIRRIAVRWAGERFAGALLEAWRLAEEAILAFPNISPLYSTFGFVWYRLWARPLVPNIEAIPAAERAYYRDFMCTTPHNPNNVDLSRDVLFQLTSAEKSRKDVERIDKNLRRPMDQAVAALESVREEANRELGQGNVFEDQCIRLKALRCWFLTQRNVAAWIAGVHGYMEAESPTEKQKHRKLLREMMESEIENSIRLLGLLAGGLDFMAVTDLGETPLMHGGNLGRLLQRRIALMRKHMDDEPYIDPGYIEKMAGLLME